MFEIEQNQAMAAPSNVSLPLLILRHELQTGEDKHAVPASALVAASGCAPSTITGLLRTADQAGLLTWTARHGARLTDAGRRAALRQLRRHRIMETYLQTALGFDWAMVHDEAERIDTQASDLLIERMDAALDHPTHDPHGDPIPDADGSMMAPRACCRPDAGVTAPRTSGPLTNLPNDRSLRVLHIVGNDPPFLALLGQHGIRPGVGLRITARDAVAGTLSGAPDGGRPLTLSLDAARRIHAEIRHNR